MHTEAERQHIPNRLKPRERKRAHVRPSAQIRIGLSGWQLKVKYLFDIIVTLIALPVSLPIWVFAALAIKMESTGPVLYKQVRIGLDGNAFTLYKFRSMHDGSDDASVRGDLQSLNEADGPVFKMKNDPRVTKVGFFLRRTSMDEIPQLINVLRGEMSLVGPRPGLPREVQRYGEREKRRLTVRPGLTCLWQIQGRSNIPFDRWVDLDLEYIEKQSLWLDALILLKTIPAVLKGSGAW
jgi:exopolysaccharide biosynthesis polyprenyl glycosylphosphotransferase